MAIKYRRICVKPKVSILQCCLSIESNIDPWGTPQFKIPFSKRVFSRLTIMFRFYKSKSNQSFVLDVKPKYFILSRSKSWYRVSSAFCKSNSIIPVDFPDSELFSIFYIFVKYVCFPWCSMSFLNMNLSIILNNIVGSNNTGL